MSDVEKHLSKKIVMRLMKQFRAPCDECQEHVPVYCGQCGGLRCEACFKLHLLDCVDCVKVQ